MTAPWYEIVLQGLIFVGILAWIIPVIGDFMRLIFFRAPVRVYETVYILVHADPTRPNFMDDMDERHGHVSQKMRHFENRAAIEGKARRVK
jgi:hypothetical protein